MKPDHIQLAGDDFLDRKNTGRLFLSTRSDSYPTKLMIALVLSLSSILLVVHLPINRPTYYVGWYRDQSMTRINIESMSDVAEVSTVGGAPITKQGPGIETSAGIDSTVVSNEEGTQPPTVEEIAASRPISRLKGREVMEFAAQMPELIGGLSTYYLNIDYPDEARVAAIQGRLVLEFVVETDGRVSNITVLQPLHPSCDSAAVRALRISRFAPGVHNGVTIPVKMRLPVRFELLDPVTGKKLEEGSS